MSSDKKESVSKEESIQCFLKVSIGGEILKDDIVIDLDMKTRPKTCQSFIALCTNDNDDSNPPAVRTSRRSPQPTYRGCEFHRVVPGLCVQAGDWERFDGTGGFSPLWGRNWKDEESKGNKHVGEGIVSMANAGKPSTNGSQFFVTLKPTPHLDGKHVVFGKVVSGMESVHKMANVERGEKDRPVSLQRIIIEDCGTLKERKEEDQSHRSKKGRHQTKKESKKKLKKKHDRKHRRHYDSSSSSSSDDDYCRKHRDSRKSRKKKHRRHRYDSGEDDSSVSSSDGGDQSGRGRKRSRDERNRKDRKEKSRDRKSRKYDKR